MPHVIFFKKEIQIKLFDFLYSVLKFFIQSSTSSLINSNEESTVLPSKNCTPPQPCRLYVLHSF